MLLFLADNHYNNHPGKNIYEQIRNRYNITFAEDNLSPLAVDIEKYALLILHVIPGTPNSDMRSTGMEQNVKAYVDAGKPLLLLHGSSNRGDRQIIAQRNPGYLPVPLNNIMTMKSVYSPST